MLKLAKLTDYAVSVMVQLTREDSAASAPVLASRTGVPEPTVAKVLKALARGGLVTSERGVSGGYRLAQAADKISIGQVIEAMDGPIAIVSCVEEGADACSAESKCPAKNKWRPVNTVIRDALLAVSLRDMAATACATTASAPKIYKIGAGAAQTTEALHAGHE